MGMDAAIYDGELYLAWQTKDITTSTDGDWDLVISSCTVESGAGGTDTGIDDGQSYTMLWIIVIVSLIAAVVLMLRKVRRK